MALQSTRMTNKSLVRWGTSLFSTRGPGDAKIMTGSELGNVSARTPLFLELVAGLLAFST